MAETVENTKATEVEPEAPEKETPEAQEGAKVEAWVGSIRESAGVKAEPSPEIKEAIEQSSPGGKEKPKELPQEAKAEEGPKVDPATRPSLANLHEKHAARLLQRENERLSERLSNVVATLERLQNGKAETTKAPEAAAEDPEPDFDLEPKAWHEWRERQTESKISAKLDPVLQGHEKERQEEEQRQEAAAKAEKWKAINAAIREREAEYEATDEGDGYRERLDAYRDYVMKDLARQGADEHTALAAFARHAFDIMQAGARQAMHPIAYLDGYILERAREAQALPAARGAAKGASETAASPPAQRTKKQEDAESELAATSALASSPEAVGAEREATSGGASATDVATLARKGRVTPDQIKELATRTNRDPRELATDLMRAAMS